MATTKKIQQNPIAQVLRKSQSLTDEQVQILKVAGYRVKPARNGGYLIEDAFVSSAWRTGGRSGGNCWGGESDEEVEVETKPRWLEDLLETICPDVTYLKFKRLEEACTQYTFTQRGYYGNYDKCTFEVLSLSDLSRILAR